MLFEDREEKDMATKEININFRTSEEFRDHLYREAGKLDMAVSEVIRASVLLALPQIKAIHGIGRIQLEDMKNPAAAP